ncbi:MAG: hypothetical protein U0Q22_16890 [Acidimicrobiales bacterium]
MPIQIKAILLLLVAAMVGILVYVNNNAITGSDEASLSKPSYVERLIPASGTEVLSQSTVGIDLVDGYDAYLVINGKKITNDVTETDQDGLRKAPSLGTVEYDPAPGRRIPKLDSPRQCVDAFVWKKLDGPATAKQVNWCFRVS